MLILVRLDLDALNYIPNICLCKNHFQRQFCENTNNYYWTKVAKTVGYFINKLFNNSD